LGKGEKERGKESARERGAEGRLGAAEGENGIGTGGRGGARAGVNEAVRASFVRLCSDTHHKSLDELKGGTGTL